MWAQKLLLRFQNENSVFEFLQRSVNSKHFMRFQSETFVFKFLRPSVDGKHLICFPSKISVFIFLVFGFSWRSLKWLLTDAVRIELSPSLFPDTPLDSSTFARTLGAFCQKTYKRSIWYNLFLLREL